MEAVERWASRRAMVERGVAESVELIGLADGIDVALDGLEIEEE